MTQSFQAEYKKLNQKQKEAVSSIEGPVMVIAGPGTGKTTILTLRIANILKETDTQPENILALTFTESAVFAMRQKLFNLIGSVAYRVNIMTFHGFCNSLIEQYPENYKNIISAEPITESGQLRLIEEIINKGEYFLIRPLGDPTYYVKKIKIAISHLKKEGFTVVEYKKLLNKKIELIKDSEESYNKKTKKLKSNFVREMKKLDRSLELADVYDKYQINMQINKFYDFDDMILQTLEAFEKDNDFLLEQQERFQYFLADEHQDANTAQNKILEFLANFYQSPNLFIVGDEKQAIFRFQGASLDNFLYFKDRFKETKLIRLEDNYRSTQVILDNAFELISNNQQKDKDLNFNLRGKTEGESAILITEYKQRNDENFGVCLKIEELIKAGTNPNEIALIYRDNADLSDVTKILDSKKIPFFVRSKQNLFETDEYFKIKIFLEALCCVEKPEKIIPFLHLDFLELPLSDIYVLSRKINRENTIFESFEKIPKKDFVEYDKVYRIINILGSIAKDAKTNYALRVFEKAVNQLGLLDNFLSSSDSVKKISVLKKIYDEIRINSNKKRAYLISDFIKHLNILEKYDVDVSVGVDGLDTGISLMTAHGSKGLEFEHVFVIYCNQKKWCRKPMPVFFDLPYLNSGFENYQTIEDERRLFYVAITRAKKQVYLSYSLFDLEGKEDVQSQFISELRSDLILFDKYQISHDDFRVNFLTQNNSDFNIKNKEYLNKLFLNRPMSVTALNNYLKCPWRYFYSNLIRIPIEMSESLALGNAMHACLNWYVKNLKNKPSVDELKNIFEEKLDDQFVSQEMKKNIVNDSNSFFVKYFEKVLDKIDKNIEFKTEYNITDVFIDIGRGMKLQLKGKLDRIDFISENKVRVIDYKTSKPKSVNYIKGLTKGSDGDYYRQLVFYKLLIDSHKSWEMVDAELNFVKPNDRGEFVSRIFNIPESDIIQLQNQIKQVANDILDLNFWNKKCDDPECEFCRMRKSFN